MVKIERNGIPIRTREDVVHIDDLQAQQLVLYYFNEHPGKYEIEYEPHEFLQQGPDGKTRGARPDLRRTSTSTGRSVYIELTTAPRHSSVERGQRGKLVHNPDADFKSRQRGIMEEEGEVCIFLYREELTRLSENHPEYNFFTAKKLKPEGEGYRMVAGQEEEIAAGS
ncbi:MAG TPA: hypothetical protein VHE53_05385 [Patescibacteria group bacterium]|nr:hypothetical protein [Patescibacteria group bacterium]